MGVTMKGQLGGTDRSIVIGVIISLIILAPLVYLANYSCQPIFGIFGEEIYDEEAEANRTRTENTTVFSSIRLSSDFKIFGDQGRSYPVLKINPSEMNSTEVWNLLMDAGFLYRDHNSSMTNTTESELIQNSNNSTYIGLDGYIEFNNRESVYNPVGKDKLENSSEFYNKSEALEYTKRFLTDEGILNSSWMLRFNLTQYRYSLGDNGPLVLHFFYHFVPIYKGVPIVDPKAPFIIVRIDPMGTILQCMMIMKEIEEMESSDIFIANSDDVLQELDTNHHYYSISTNTTFKDMRICYRRNAHEGLQLYPNWILTYGNAGLTHLHLADFDE